MNIATAGNAETACLQAILDLGYKVSTRTCDDVANYVATKDDLTFSGESSIEVLGLIKLGEMWGKDWQKNGLGRDAWDKIEYVD